MADEMESLATRIAAALKGTRERANLDDDDGEGGSAQARIRKLAAEKKALAEKMAEMEAQVNDLRKGYESHLAKLRQDAATEVQTIASRHAEDLTLVDLGFKDPLGRKALRDAWEAQPKATRGDNPLAYVEQLRAAQAEHVADPAKPAPNIPPTLRGYMPDAQTPAAKAAPGAKAAPPVVGKVPPKPGAVDPYAELFASIERIGGSPSGS
jgi:hypothetical protein